MDLAAVIAGNQQGAVQSQIASAVQRQAQDVLEEEGDRMMALMDSLPVAQDPTMGQKVDVTA